MKLPVYSLNCCVLFSYIYCLVNIGNVCCGFNTNWPFVYASYKMLTFSRNKCSYCLSPFTCITCLCLPVKIDFWSFTFAEEENERLKEMLMCRHCETNQVNCLFLPCTHHKLCINCAKKVDMCPVCGRDIQDKIRTYMS